MTGKIKKFLIRSFLLLFPIVAQASGFEGTITLVKQTYYDTTFYTYLVADGKIRIEEYNSKKNLQNVYIINTNNNQVLIINPGRKIYTKLNSKLQENAEEKTFTITKSTNSKIINGITCYQWRVKNRDKNTEISYWVTQNDFDFFEKMVKILNHTDRSWEFFNHIPQTQGYMPMLSVERNLVRDEKMRTSVIEINRRNIDTSIFKVPTDYKLCAM